MKTLLFALIPLILFSGCVHKVSAGHVTSNRYTEPVYHKVFIVKKERNYSIVREKKQRREKHNYRKHHISHQNPHSYAMHQRPKTKNRKNGGAKVHPKYQEVKKSPDKGEKKERR